MYKLRPHRVPPIKTKSLLEEVKDSVRWSDRVSPSVGLNKSVIQPAPGGVCFSLEDSWKYDHAQVRDLIESQINCSVCKVFYSKPYLYDFIFSQWYM